MKKFLAILLLAVSAQAMAVDILRHEDTFVQVDVITNTTGGAYENFEIISLHPNAHKVVVIRANNSRYITEFCSQVEKNSEAGQNCNPYDPEPIFADWDAAQAAGNITLGANLTGEERRKYTAHWFFQLYVSNDLNGLYNELIADLTLTDSQRRERYFGTCRAYEFDNATCANFVTIRFDTGRRPRSNEMTLLKVPGRFKKMIDEMGSIIIE